MRALLHAFLVVSATLAGCGGGDDAPAPKPATATPPPAAAPAPSPGAVTSAPPLPSALRVEKIVECPPPRQDAKKCDPNAMKAVSIGGAKPEKSDPNDLVCADDQHCLPTTAGYLCGACPERDSIRHAFKDRDFAPENNRDPFQSFVLNQGIIGPEANKPQVAITKKCREDNLVATNYSYTDLRLVGIVAQGTQRKVLMMDAGNLGHIIRRGDCVGRERAYVKDIGTGYVTFEVNPDETGSPQVRAEERSVQLYPNQMPIMSQPNLDNEPVRPQTPDVAPPTTPPPTPERK